MVESKLRYEECRKQRLEENKKRMEELNLGKLAQALKTSSPKSSPLRQVKSRSRLPLEPSSVPPRRSSRVADKPPPCYKEQALLKSSSSPPFLLAGLGRTPGQAQKVGLGNLINYQRRDLLNRRYASDEARKYAIERAEQVQSGLESDFPSFVKPMLQSHVTGGFWLGLPVQFCKKHLPRDDEMLSLVDEEGNEFPTKYLADKHGLSGGWRGFSIDHQLVDGDAVVFHLVRPTELKVYIIRAHDTKADEESEVEEEDLDVTPLGRSAKRTRASNMGLRE